MGEPLLPPLRLGGVTVPVVGATRLYACGVTPYDVTHLGHAATFVWVDVLVRMLRHAGRQPTLTRNVTDVDDVLTAAAQRAGAPYDEFAAMQQYRFEHDMSDLGVRRPDREPRAHQHVGDVVQLAQALLDQGRAYVAGGSVYFRGDGVARAAGLEEAVALDRLREFGEDPDDPAKQSPHDVPVWRASGSDDPSWPSPWGPGRPGWHAECTAMVLATTGPSIDIHAGGADLAFPHHAYELAQAEAATGVAPFSRAWMRVGTVCVNGAKMAKSTGNLVLVSDLLRDHRPSPLSPAAWPTGQRAAALRMLLLHRPWAQAWDFDMADLVEAQRRVDELLAVAAGAESGGVADTEGERAVMERLLDDLDVVGAMEVALGRGGQGARVLVSLLGLA